MLLPGGPDGDLNVLTQSGEEFRKVSDGKVARVIRHQQGGTMLLPVQTLDPVSHETTALETSSGDLPLAMP